ncbi:MAG: hypothetical protein IJG87_07105 [Ruminococcus sp.]|nr:hypothetical protein [Ruminococcus sp.]
MPPPKSRFFFGFSRNQTSFGCSSVYRVYASAVISAAPSLFADPAVMR